MILEQATVGRILSPHGITVYILCNFIGTNFAVRHTDTTGIYSPGLLFFYAGKILTMPPLRNPVRFTFQILL